MGALGYTIHSLYGVLENYFLRVSKFFENSLPGDRWHKGLVEKMSLEIPDVRPPVLTRREDKQEVLELLKFRHRFRNLYGEDLDPQRTAEIERIAQHFFSRFPDIHATFREKIMAIAESLR